MGRRSSTSGYGNYGGKEIEESFNLQALADDESIRHMSVEDESPQSTTQTGKNEKKARKKTFFSAFSFNAGFEDEVEASKQEMEERKATASVEAQTNTKAKIISNPKTGQAFLKESVAQQVVNDDEQWKQLQAQMRRKGGRTSIMLKHNLDEMLQNQLADLEEKGQTNESTMVKPRRASIVDFASTLIRGDEKASRGAAEAAGGRSAAVPGPAPTASTFETTTRRLSAALLPDSIATALQGIDLDADGDQAKGTVSGGR